MSWDSPYFTKDEMRCQCGCNQDGMNAKFMEKLTALRAEWDKPMVVNSGYRCTQHPIEARKAKPGAHATGRAVDIAVEREEALRLLHLAISHGFTGIGVQQKGGGRFLHFDDLTAEDGMPRPTIWSY